MDGLWEGSRVVGLAEGIWLLGETEGREEGRADGEEEVGRTVGLVEG